VKALFIIVLSLAIFSAAGYVTYEMFIRPKEALKEEKAQPLPPPPPDPTLPDFANAMAVRKKGNLLDAREALYAFVEHFPESSKIDEAKEALGEINTDIFLSTRPAPEKELYIVKSGDVINRVAAKLKTPPELLMRANNLEGTMLRIGQKLYVSPAEFSLVISRRHDKVTLLNKGRFFKQYAIRSWPPVQAKKALAPGQKAPPLPKQTGRVTDKIAWLDGQRVIYTDKGYANATHWISISIPGCTLYAEPPPEEANKPNSHPSSGGIALAPEACMELAAMLSKNTPVTLE
jgi:LysM repeat protein